METRSGRKKEATHERIVKTAARALRKRGVAGLGVADVMQEAGLTHGGFYAHFKSKGDLLAEAADHAAGESLDHLRKSLRNRQASEDPLRTLVETYLSRTHLERPERGCLLSAYGSELQRESAAVRRVMTDRTRELVDLVHQQMPGWQDGQDKSRAISLLASMVGAMILARAVDDPALADAILASSIEQLAPMPTGTR